MNIQYIIFIWYTNNKYTVEEFSQSEYMYNHHMGQAIYFQQH